MFIKQVTKNIFLLTKRPILLSGDDEDRARLEDMTEREREEELFKRAENRENLRKRFEIQKKLKQQQKLKDKDGEKKEKKKVNF